MIKNLLNLFFPKVCYACDAILSDNELHICTSCRHDLPVTNYHFNNDDPVKKVLYGRTDIKQGTALFHFQKQSRVQQLLHNLKYQGHHEIGKTLGQWLGHELKASGKYTTIDLVVPVPLHKKKQRKRGYNQVAKFGQEIARALNVPYHDSILVKTSSTETQVHKKRRSRWQNDQEVFTVVNLDLIKNKHVLIVDDVITTGATLEACAQQLQKGYQVKISIATIAIA